MLKNNPINNKNKSFEFEYRKEYSILENKISHSLIS